MQYVNPRIITSHSGNELSRAIRRIIIHHQDVNIVTLGQYAFYQCNNVVAFVIGWNDDKDLHGDFFPLTERLYPGPWHTKASRCSLAR